ncbi:MAG: SWIM zinc finger family protein [Anaerolineae bacterium]|nr:SWIM zinc finger family protein [Anaerolineae bacterium]
MMSKRRSSYYDDYWPRYESTRPIEVQDGIKAKSQWGKFVKNWWGDRWIAALKNLMDSGRLSRGRSYARRGQVIEINVKPGLVQAKVQGSRRSPYKVSIELQPLGNIQWERVFDALSEQAIFAAQLLNGEMPQEIEQVFDAVHVPLFPSSKGDLETDCSCPDWANPCKHIAAVYFLLGEQFDQDPFLLFLLRGQTKTQIAAALRERRAQGIVVAEEPARYVPDTIEQVEVSALADCLDHYWSSNEELADMQLHLAAPQVDMALLKRLGIPDFVAGGRSFWAQMERVYAGVATKALNVAFADPEQDAIEEK